MTLESALDLAGLQRIGSIVAHCLQLMGDSLEPGMTTREVDEIGRVYLASKGARSAPRLTYDFPGTTCISINHDIAHGIPGEQRIKAGDLVNIDVSAELEGYFGDTGGSFSVPPDSRIKTKLCEVTRQALNNAMAEARAGQPLNVIGRAIERTALANQLTVIRNLGSHGVGRALHEEPGFIAPYHDPKDKRRLKEGMVITIEPFISNGAQHVNEGKDGWTLSMSRPYLAAQFEHTIVITKGQPLIMTLPLSV